MPSALQIDFRNLRPERPPVVLLGGLNVLRTLGLARIPAIVASPSTDALAFWSRYCSGRCYLPPLEHSAVAAEMLAEAGARLAEALGRPVPLFYGNDDALNLVVQHRELLAPHFSMVLNDPEVAAALLDKARFEPFARRQNLPVPHTLEWSSVGAWPHPVLVKPKLKTDWKRSPVHVRLFGGAGKARVFPSGRALALDALARQLRDELIIQEYVPGGDRQLWSFHGYADASGQQLAWFIGRKVRTYPALTGASTCVELARNDELAELGRCVAARAGLKGVFKMDFKRNVHTGEWRLLEINARFNLWHYPAARNGINLMEIAYEHLIRGARPPANPHYGTRYRWVAVPADYHAYRELAVRGELSAVAWLVSLLRPKVYELHSWRDPLPLLGACLRKVKRIPRLTGRLRRWLSTAS